MGKKEINEEVHNFMKVNGAKGGQTTKLKHGREHYVEIGKKGGKANKKVIHNKPLASNNESDKV